MKFCGHLQKFDGAWAYSEGALHKLCFRERGEGAIDHQLLVLHVQLRKSVDELREIGLDMDVNFPSERPRQWLDWLLVGFQVEPTEPKGRDVGEIIDESHERTESRGEGVEGEVCECFTER